MRDVIPTGARPWCNFTLMLLPVADLLALPDGTIVTDITGRPVVKTKDIDTDTRCGMTAYGLLQESP